MRGATVKGFGEGSRRGAETQSFLGLKDDGAAGNLCALSEPDIEFKFEKREELRGMQVPRWACVMLVVPWLICSTVGFIHGRWIVNDVWATSLWLAGGCFALAQAFKFGNRGLAVMGFGLSMRVINEISGSFGKAWWIHKDGEAWFLVIFYLVTFILPALIFCDWWRLRRLEQESKSATIPVDGH